MISIIMPCETVRVPLLLNTLEAYLKYGIPEGTEFIIPSRTLTEISIPPGINYKIIPYTHDLGFNPSKALNIGLRNSSNPYIIITSPEVMPKTDVLKQLSESLGQNVVCQVWEQNQDGSIGMSLVNSKFRTEHPGYYFLAMFNKSDVLKINGWDEEFMKGYAWEDDDFGHRWMRAGIPFIVRDDIEATHQWHPRTETIPNGWSINHVQMIRNDTHRIIRPKSGVN